MNRCKTCIFWVEMPWIAKRKAPFRACFAHSSVSELQEIPLIADLYKRLDHLRESGVNDGFFTVDAEDVMIAECGPEFGCAHHKSDPPED